MSVDYLKNKICFIIHDKIIAIAALKPIAKRIANEQGEVIEVKEVYFPLSLPDNELSSEQENIINFSIKIIDYNDAVAFRKYEPSYHQAGITVFEIFRRLSCGKVLLVLLMDWRNYCPQGSEGGKDWVGLLPDDAACIFSLVSSQLTVEEKVSSLPMTCAEITTAIEIAKERLARAKQAGPNTPEFEFFWRNYEYDDLTPEDYQDTTIPIIGVTNRLEQLLEWYSLNREAFPNQNLFSSTNLQLYEHWLQFTLHSDEVDALTKRWYEAARNLKTYEYRHEEALRNRLTYWRWFWRSESDGRDGSDSDSERENWEELTDGQDGTWEDWHEPNN